MKSLVLIVILLIVMNSTHGIGEYHYIGDCASLLEEYATSAADFMLCAVSNARPIHMCSSCVGAYNGVMEGHNKILEITESDTNITCKNRLINLDRLEIIEAGFSYVTNLWDKGRCSNCFETDQNLPFHLSNATLTFQNLYQDTEACLLRNFNPDNDTYDTAVCQNCTNIYHRMNLYYDTLKLKFGDGQLCMDIVDAMNITQNMWSGNLHCGEEIQTPEVPLIVSLLVVLFLPFVFYLAAWKMSLTPSAPVLRQKRLSQKFVDRLRSRTNSMISQFR